MAYNYVSDGRLGDKEYYKKPKYPVVIEALKVFLLVSGIVPIMLYAGYELADGTYAHAWYAIGYLLMPWLSTYVRRCIPSVILYFVLHLVMGAWVPLSPHLILTCFGVIYWPILTVYGVVRQMSKQSERELSMPMLLLVLVGMICVYIVAVDHNYMAFTPVLMSLAILYGIMFLYYQHWIGVHDALKSLDKEGNFSVRRVISFNNKMFLGYLGIVVVLFAVLYVAGMDDLINYLTAMMIMFIRRVSRLLSEADTSEGYIEEEAPPAEQEGVSPEMAMVPGETAPIWLILEFILEVVFFAVVIGFIAYCCYSAFKRFSEVHKYQEQDYEETKVFYKAAPKQKKQRRSLKDMFDNSPENKIRRAYYKKVRGHMGKKVHPYETPIEVAETLPDVRELVQAYDEARYAHKGGSHE